MTQSEVLVDAWADLTTEEQQLLYSVVAGCPILADASTDLALLEKRLVRFEGHELVATGLGFGICGRRPVTH